MPYSVSGTDVRGVSTVNRKTAELALRKARELINRDCYDVRITTPEGRTYHSAEFADLPRVIRRHQLHRHGLRLIAIEIVGDLHIGCRDRERARRLAGLTARGAYFRARRLRLKLQRNRRHSRPHQITARRASCQRDAAKQKHE